MVSLKTIPLKLLSSEDNELITELPCRIQGRVMSDIVVVILDLMRYFSALLAYCHGTPPARGQWSSAIVFPFSFSLNAMLNKQSRCRYCETSWRSCTSVGTYRRPFWEMEPHQRNFRRAIRYWGRDKTVAIRQTSSLNAFSWMKSFNFDYNFTDVSQWSIW